MDPISKKVKQWIDNGKDPRSAHWQAGLEAMLDIFAPYLEPGKLVPVHALKEADIPIYEKTLEMADLSPNLSAAFLPPDIAGKIIPPQTAEELLRIYANLPSYKMLIMRQAKEPRLMCVEVSPHAKKPGVDIFEAGALLGSYDYNNYEDCMNGLTQPIRAHLWQKDPWSLDEYHRYTINWFEKVLDLQSKNVQVEQNFSFFHSPTLIKSNKIDAILTLVEMVLQKRISDPHTPINHTLVSIRKVSDKHQHEIQLVEFVERAMLEYLNVMRDFELINFSEFSNKENEQFKIRFSGTMDKIITKLNP